jgi:hypothetical protein
MMRANPVLCTALISRARCSVGLGDDDGEEVEEYGMGLERGRGGKGRVDQKRKEGECSVIFSRPGVDHSRRIDCCPLFRILVRNLWMSQQQSAAKPSLQGVRIRTRKGAVKAHAKHEPTGG